MIIRVYKRPTGLGPNQPKSGRENHLHLIPVIFHQDLFEYILTWFLLNGVKQQHARPKLDDIISKYFVWSFVTFQDSLRYFA